MTPRVARLLAAVIVAGAAAPTLHPAEKAKVDKVKHSGYLEFRKPAFLIVDAQRVQITSKTKFKGTGRAKSLENIPMGYELKVRGVRVTDGTIVADEIQAEPNRTGSAERELLSGSEQAEQAWVQAKKVYEPGPDGKEIVMGALHDSGPQVDRARRIVDRVLPAHVDRQRVSVYVVDNKEWNAMAMANFSIYVFSGLMADLDDDELAIVLGHEIAHATHEHSLKQAKSSQFTGIAGAIVATGAELIDNPLAKTAVQGAGALGMTTFGNTYSREHEDQADRVGLRYVYEAGYDYTKAPKLWNRFAQKYGDQDKVTNFFFGDHSTSAKRAKDLEIEIANNYKDLAKDPPAMRAADK